MQLTRRMPDTSRIRAIEQLETGTVNQLQAVLAIEGEQRRVHHLQNACQQRSGLKRAHALLLQ